MVIISKQIIENTKLKHSYRIELEYTFDDGTVRTIKCRGPLSSSADEYLINKESQVLDSKINQDTDTAIKNDSDEPTADATQTQIYKAWMFKGYQSDDPIESYKYLSKVAEKVIDLGLTVEQLSEAFNESVETVNKVLAKWQYLNTNKDSILAYKIIKDGING